MARKLHGLLALAGGVLALVLAISGTILSVYPLGARLAPEVQSTQGVSVAQLAGGVLRALPGVESVKRMPSGALVASSFDANGLALKNYVDAKSGAVLHAVPPRDPFYAALRTFHRSLFIGNPGRYVTGLGAALLALMAVSGIMLLIHRMGGIGHVFLRVRGNWSHRAHTWLARWVLVGLVLSSLTGVYMVMAEFGYLPLTNAESRLYPASVDGQPATTPDKLAGLQAIPLSNMQELTFPMAGDPQDVFTVKTESQIVLVDRGTGKVLEKVALTRSERLYDLIYRLHTGKGMVLIGLFLGLCALGVPVLASTGSVIWFKRRQATHRRIRGNIVTSHADVVVLVGSQGGATWGFAQTLHTGLTAAGFKVHVGPLNDFTGHYPKACLVLFLSSTYGNGTAPASASRFATRLADMAETPEWSYAVLGFGDRAFAQFCAFAKQIDTGLADHGCARAMRPEFINRQSTQAFANWGNDLAQALDVPLALSHRIAVPATRRLTLVARKVYGSDPKAQTAVLQLQDAGNPRAGLWRRLTGQDGKRPRFTPSDLLAVLPPDSDVPRYYSVASAASDSEVEICVRQQTGGECSTFLHDLPIGGQINAFVRTNPDFAAPVGRKPVIMVSAGTGIAPFVGMARANIRHAPILLYWGGRASGADFLYEDTLSELSVAGQLTNLRVVFSRQAPRAYVQDAVKEDTEMLRAMLAKGASVMVCGGDGMAQAVAQVFDAILAPTGQSVAQMRTRGTYLEDIF